MSIRAYACIAVAGCFLTNMQAVNAQSLVTGGSTSVALDFSALESAAGLAFSSISSEVISPGDIADSVAFPITSRNAATLPSNFSYDAGSFPAAGSFAGTIEHSGSVLFNNDSVEVGDFTIGFDGGRASGAASGFFVASNAGIAAPLFDIEVTGANPQVSSLVVDGNLLVSPELGQFLLDQGLASMDLSGVGVGVAQVNAIASLIPEPASLALACGALSLLIGRRRVRP